MVKALKRIGKGILHFFGIYDISKLIFSYKVLKGEYTFQTNIFGPEWNRYLKPDASSKRDLDVLCAGLDAESKAVAELIYERFQRVLSIHPVLISNSLFTKQELEEQKKITKEIGPVLKKYSLTDKYISVGPLCNYSGLAYLPKECTDKLKQKVFIDGGAYVGQAAIPFLEYNPSKIYCFEPVSNNHNVLIKHIENNKASGTIIPVKKGLGNTPGNAAISISGNSSAITQAGDKDTEQIQIETIDNFVRQNNVTDIGLIKLDVEGFEMNVIQGALETIKAHKPVLIISVYHRPDDFFKIKPFLQERFPEYKFMIRKTNPYWFTYDTVLMAY